MSPQLSPAEALRLAHEAGKEAFGNLEGQTKTVLLEFHAAIYSRLGEQAAEREFSRQMSEAAEHIGYVRSALNPASRPDWDLDRESKSEAIEALGSTYIGSAPDQVIWPFPNLKRAIFDSAKRIDDWHHNQEELRAEAGRYLREYWSYSPTLERIFISALTYTEAQAFVHATVYPKTLMGALSASKKRETALIAHLRKAATWRLLRSLLLLSIGALIPSLFVGAGYGFSLGVPTFLAFYGLYSWKAAWAARAVPDSQSSSLKLCNEMADASVTADKPPLVPSVLKAELQRAHAKGAVWPPELWQFVLRAEDRCRWTLALPPAGVGHD